MSEFTIVAVGDSTTAGTPGFKSPIEAPPDGAGVVESQYAYWLMRAYPDWHVLNRGVNGERSDQIRVRLARDILHFEPDVLVIIAGVNDIYQGRRADAIERELEAMYDMARTTSRVIPVVAGSILPYGTASVDENARMHEVNDWIRASVARHPHVAFCDTRAAVAQPGKPDCLVSSPDDLHPSPEAYRLMALALGPVIKRALSNLQNRSARTRRSTTER
jgi:lysophospholipase L1-like esterase